MDQNEEEIKTVQVDKENEQLKEENNNNDPSLKVDEQLQQQQVKEEEENNNLNGEQLQIEDHQNNNNNQQEGEKEGGDEKVNISTITTPVVVGTTTSSTPITSNETTTTAAIKQGVPPVKSTITISKVVPLSTASISSVMPAIGKRLNVSIDQLEARITADQYDTEAWTLLLNEVQSQPITIARDIYERFLAIYPTAGRYWKLYVEQELLAKNIEQVEKIFVRALRSVRNVELWKVYISYIRSNTGNSREEVIKAFELALEYVGMDIASTSIWTEYIAFAKEERTSSANAIEEGQRMSALRRLYQRAVENPMHDLDYLWREYEAFENTLSKQLAKALLSEYLPKYQLAKTVYRDRKAIIEGILKNMLARPPRATEKESYQVRQWRKLIAYEKTNPQRFDANQLRIRVTATYNQCLLCLYHYPDIWLEAATYQVDNGGNFEMANQFFDRALVAIPNSLFLSFAYADTLEANKKFDKAKEIYEKLVSNPQQPPSTLAWVQYMRFSRRHERVEGPRRVFKRAKASPSCTYHIYIALGFIEYYINQDAKIARDILELGLKKFQNEPAYINFYIDFLSSLSEENNTRVLFQKIITTIPSMEKSEALWRKYLDFEYRQNQDINEIIKLEKKYQALTPGNEKLATLQTLNRYKFMNLWACHPNEIEIMTKNLIDDDEEDQDDQKQIDDEGTQPQQQDITTKKRFGGKGRNNNLEQDEKENKYQNKQQQQGGGNKSSSSSSKIPQSSLWRGMSKPDITQMIPYRSEMGKSSNTSQGRQSDSPNVVPEFLIQLLQILPPTAAFNGPWVDVDQVLQLIKDTPLPNIQSLGMMSPQSTNNTITTKRKTSDEGGINSNDMMESEQQQQDFRKRTNKISKQK